MGSTVEHKLEFLDDVKFRYSETIIGQEEASNIITLPTIEGTYTYTGTPSQNMTEENNLSFTYTIENNEETKTEGTYTFNDSSESVTFTIENFGRFLDIEKVSSEEEDTTTDEEIDNGDDTGNTDDSNTASLEGTIWKTDTYNASQINLDGNEYLTLAFNSDGKCILTTYFASGGTMADENCTYSLIDEELKISYASFTSMDNDISKTTISDNSFDINIYGDDVTFTKE